LPLVSYVDTTGKAYTLESLKGKVVVVNFWATWCGPCKKEIPDLSKLYRKYKDQGVVMLGILSNDNPTDTDLLNFQSDYDMEFPVVRQSSDILLSFNYPQALPTTFVFDRHGRRVGAPRVGAIQMEAFDAQLSQLVAQK
jgi:thiol-disulfide isomerase/thioredoxin